MITKEKILRTEQLCYDFANDLTSALGALASMASEVLGYEVVADICNGNEIEFRTMTDNGVADNNVTIRMEDILDIIRIRSGKL